MKKHEVSYKRSGQLKNLLIRVWEILRGVGQDLPLSVEDISKILIEQDREMEICEEPFKKDKYNTRLIRANIKAINAALAFPPPNYEVTRQRDHDRSKRFKSKTFGNSADNSEESLPADQIEKCFVGRREDKECLYYNKGALTAEERRFLLDAVRSASFLSGIQADDLCRRLVALCGAADSSLRHERHPQKNTSLDTDVFETLRTIKQAIELKKQLHFKYCKGWAADNDFIWYRESVDPIAVLYSNGYYYLCGYSVSANSRCAFRVDRMKSIKIEDVDSVDAEQRHEFFGGTQDVADWLFASQTTVSDPVEVTIRISGRLVLEMYDKFGSNLKITTDSQNPKLFIFKQSITASPEFFGWCASYGGDLEIISPENVRNDFAKFLMKAAKHFHINDLLSARYKVLK